MLQFLQFSLPPKAAKKPCNNPALSSHDSTNQNNYDITNHAVPAATHNHTRQEISD
jgi:hypothetical protein